MYLPVIGMKYASCELMTIPHPNDGLCFAFLAYSKAYWLKSINAPVLRAKMVSVLLAM